MSDLKIGRKSEQTAMGTSLETGICSLDIVYSSIIGNIEYFASFRDIYGYANDFVTLLQEQLLSLKLFEQFLSDLNAKVDGFDFRDVKANGYRSFGLIFERCFSECHKLSLRLCINRTSVFFRHRHFLKETNSLNKVLEGLKPIVKFIYKMLKDNVSDLLVSNEIFTPEEVVIETDDINQAGFYGRYQGFYYSATMKRIVDGMTIMITTLSDFYWNTGRFVPKAFLTVSNGVKYAMDPELRAERFLDIIENSTIEFLKTFWSSGENKLSMLLPDFVCPKMKVREEIFIPSVEVTLQDQSLNDVVIPVPSSHAPIAPVRCILLSSSQRKGQKGSDGLKQKEKSNKLLFHCHGGGFVSQNPESHETYLRHWAYDLDVPILSISYGLAPEAPFPRALEDVLFAYAWVLKNPDTLGWTGEKICFVGDSAGGTIIMGLLLKIISLNIRLPNAIMCAYTPFILNMVTSPSRLLCRIDPLLPLGFLISCLEAYTSKMKTDTIFPNKTSSGEYNGDKQNLLYNSDVTSAFIQSRKTSEDIGSEAFDQQSSDNAIYSNENSNHYLNNELCDSKSKRPKTARFGLNKISETFSSSRIFQRVIAPFSSQTPALEKLKEEPILDSKSSTVRKLQNIRLVPENSFMSPLLASDEEYMKMPPMYLVSSTFDPCLDDSVTVAKRLQRLNRQVTLDVVNGLSHGFLNFLPFSKEAHDGSRVCVRRLNEAMDL